MRNDSIISMHMFAPIAALLYFAAWLARIASVRAKAAPTQYGFFVLLPLGLFAHLMAVLHGFITKQGFDFGLYEMASLIFLVVNATVFVTALKQPLHNLFLLLLPLSIPALIAAHYLDTETLLHHALTPALAVHIGLSILAYSLLTIATLQALLLTYQTSKLKTHQAGALIGVFPSLQTMESLLVRLLWAGFGLLTLSIVTGVFFIDSIAAQNLGQKLVFSVLSWLIYAVLLWGMHTFGWRGNRATRWVLTGFLMLMLAYFGSKFIFEVLLATQTA